jgi:hypothetical protein
MFPLDLALAVVVLTSPGEPPPLPPCPLSTIQGVALAWEILDPREGRYVLARGEDWMADIKMLRRRYLELACAPPLSDSDRWPDKELLDQCLQFNREYRGFLQDRLGWDRLDQDAIAEAITQTEYLYHVYDLVRDAKQGYYYVSLRRSALAKLREEIGPQMYYAGCLPPPVPLWSFRRID